MVSNEHNSPNGSVHESDLPDGAVPRYARNRNGRGPVRIELGKLFDRLPPAAPEAEMALLGCMILDHQVIGDVVTIVRTGDDFSRPAHSAVFTALVELWNQHNAGDITILNQVLVDRGISQDIGGVEYLLTLAESVPVSTNATHYARIVAEKAVLRRLIGASGEILQQAYANPEDVRQALDRAEGLILAVQQASERNECVALPALLVETMADIERRSEGQAVTGLTSGFRDLDDMLSGLQAGEMIVLAARPSMGKTAFALNVAEQVGLRGVPVGMFSMEMSRQQLAQRMMCSRAEIDSHRLRRNMIGKDDFYRLQRAMGELERTSIQIDDTAGLSVLELRAKARRMAAKHGVQLLIIDYLQLMSGTSRESRQQEVSEISRGVKALARELNIPVMCLSQLNRAAETREDHRPRLSDLRESGSIEQDADVVMMLHREDYYRAHDPEYQSTNVAEVIIAKQRNGPTGTVKLTWSSACTKFRDHAPEAGATVHQQAAPALTHTQAFRKTTEQLRLSREKQHQSNGGTDELGGIPI